MRVVLAYDLVNLDILSMLDWIPIVLVTFKLVVLGTGMFFAIKWHFDQANKRKAMERRAILRASGKVAAVFALSLVGLGLFTLALVRMLNLDMG